MLVPFHSVPDREEAELNEIGPTLSFHPHIAPFPSGSHSGTRDKAQEVI